MSKFATRHLNYRDAKPGYSAAPGSLPAAGHYGVELVQQAHGYSEALSLPAIVREQISKARLEEKCEIQMILLQDEELFSTVNSDRGSLNALLELLISTHFSGKANSSPHYLKLERMARLQKVTFTNTMCFTGTQSNAGPTATLTAETFKIYQIAEQLGCEIRALSGRDDTFSTQVSIPINARVTAPDPTLLQSEIVPVRQAANNDLTMNPIPRMNLTG